MSVGSRYNKADVWVPRKFQDTDTSPERTKKWIEPQMKMESKVPVVYYLSRNGHLEHPHFMEVRLSSPGGLFLRDVMNRLNCLRGQGMANMYSWSSKRTYKSGYVWQDLTEDDLIHPCNGHEYVLKGSQLLQVPSPSLRSSSATISLPATKNRSSEGNNPAEHLKLSDIIKIKNKNQLYPTSLSLDDLHQYRVYTARTSEKANKAANASTQTDDKRTRQAKRGDGHEDWIKEEIQVLSAPPPSNSSTEGRESLDGSSSTRRDPTYRLSDIRNQALENERPSGRMKASAAVLMQLIMCGSKGVDDVGLIPASR